MGPCLHRMPRADEASLVVLGRERDLPALEAMGRVEVIARSRGVRWDRTYLLARVWLTPGAAPDGPAIGALSPGRAVTGKVDSYAASGRDARGRSRAGILALGRRSGTIP